MEIHESDITSVADGKPGGELFFFFGAKLHS